MQQTLLTRDKAIPKFGLEVVQAYEKAIQAATKLNWLQRILIHAKFSDCGLETALYQINYYERFQSGLCTGKSLTCTNQIDARQLCDECAKNAGLVWDKSCYVSVKFVNSSLSETKEMRE